MTDSAPVTAQNGYFREGVKQICGKEAEQKNFYTPLTPPNDVHTFTGLVEVSFLGLICIVNLLKIADFRMFLSKKWSFVKLSELYILTVCCCKGFLNAVVKVVSSETFTCEAIVSLSEA